MAQQIDVDGLILPNKPLTNVELINACDMLKIPIRGVFMRDNLPKRAKRKECGIINLDDTFGRGTHWVCYLKDGATKLYFDSFGLQPPLELQEYLGKRGVMYSTYEIQSPEQVICGHLCLHVLNQFKNNICLESFEECLLNLF
ncbi:MAG: hypothetical protein MI700_14485 [Balneolales bacterium]|nr:hypothetical protein [Balneolales bacterium]